MSRDEERFHALTERYGFDKTLLHLRGVLTDNNLFGGDDVNPEPLRGLPLYDARGFRVSGRLGDDSYTVGVFWGGELGGHVSLRGWERDRRTVLDWIDLHRGEWGEILIPGFGALASDDSALGIYAALVLPGAHIDDFAGDHPPEWPDDEEGVVH